MTSLDFSPLTHDELNARVAKHLMTCGHRTVTVVRYGGTFEPRDLEFLTEHASLADEYQVAALQRCDR